MGRKKGPNEKLTPSCWRTRSCLGGKRKRRDQVPPSCSLRSLEASAEQPQHGLAGLVGKRQGGGRQALARLESQRVGAFLVGIGQHQAVGTRLEGVDQVLGE